MHGSTADLRRALVGAGLLVPSSVDGVYARSARFEAVLRGVEAFVGAARVVDAPRWFLPAVMPRAAFERSGYLGSFPDLVGSVEVFAGGDREHRELLRLLAAGDDWSRALVPAEVTLCSAACHPVYELLPRHVPAGGLDVEIEGTPFRHEPSADPMRMQTFRQYEFVHVGTPASARAHRDAWVDRAVEVFAAVGLATVVEVASDPFFGRLGGLRADNQVSDGLKKEVVVRIVPERGHALASSNCHLDHFGAAFGLVLADGTPAHSACVGFGLERTAIALLATHGLDPLGWPAPVRSRLGL